MNFVGRGMRGWRLRALGLAMLVGGSPRLLKRRLPLYADLLQRHSIILYVEVASRLQEEQHLVQTRPAQLHADPGRIPIALKSANIPDNRLRGQAGLRPAQAAGQSAAEQSAEDDDSLLRNGPLPLHVAAAGQDLILHAFVRVDRHHRGSGSWARAEGCYLPPVSRAGRLFISWVYYE